MIMKQLLFVAILMLAIGSQLFSQDKLSFKESYEMPEPAELNVGTSDGFIQVEGAETSTITVRFIVFKGDDFLEITRSKLEEHVDLTINQSSSELSIKVETPNQFGWNSWKDQYNVSFVITAPMNTACKLASSDGDISIRNLHSDQSCATSDGDIQAKDIKGNFKAATSDGDVLAKHISGTSEIVTSDGDILVSDGNGNVQLVTSDGDITAREIEGDASLTTSDGDIDMEQIAGASNATTSDGSILFTDMYGSLKARTSDGDIRGNFKKITAKIDLETSDGDIQLYLPAGSSITLDARGEDVRTTRENFSGSSEEERVKGTFNGGGTAVRLVSSDGDVSLKFQ